MDYYDVTVPVAQPTGREKSVEELARTDVRNERYAGLSTAEVQALLIRIEETLTKLAPDEVRERLRVAKDLATYAWFQWDFYTASLFYSLSTIEMALKSRFMQHYPSGVTMVKNGQSRVVPTLGQDFEFLLRNKWKPAGHQRFNGSFRSLMAWARDEGILLADAQVVLQEVRHKYLNGFLTDIFLPRAQADGLIKPVTPTLSDVLAAWAALDDDQRAKYRPRQVDMLVEGIPELRNELAHPKHYNMLLLPRSAIDGYWQTVEIVNRLWPSATNAGASSGGSHGQ